MFGLILIITVYKIFLCLFFQAYKPRTWLVDCAHKHTTAKDLEKGTAQKIYPNPGFARFYPEAQT